MKTASPGALLILLLAGAATAGETGIINQAGPYESTMKFYLHPAHGFAGTAGIEPTTTGSSSENANAPQSRKVATQSGKTAGQSGKTGTQPGKTVAVRSRQQPVKARASADLQFDP